MVKAGTVYADMLSCKRSNAATQQVVSCKRSRQQRSNAAGSLLQTQGLASKASKSCSTVAVTSAYSLVAP